MVHFKTVERVDFILRAFITYTCSRADPPEWLWTTRGSAWAVTLLLYSGVLGALGVPRSSPESGTADQPPSPDVCACLALGNVVISFPSLPTTQRSHPSCGTLGSHIRFSKILNKGPPNKGHRIGGEKCTESLCTFHSVAPE